MTTRSSCRSFPPARRRRGPAVLALLLTVAAAAGSASAQNDEEIIERERQTIRDTKAQREELDRAAEEAATGLDAATAEAEDLIDALNRAQAAVDAQQAALDEAERAVADAEAVVQEAEARIAELEAELLATQEGLREAVIESYVSFQAPTGTFSVLGSDPWQNAREEALAGIRRGQPDRRHRRLAQAGRGTGALADPGPRSGPRRPRPTAGRRALILGDLRTAVDREAELSVAGRGAGREAAL